MGPDQHIFKTPGQPSTSFLWDLLCLFNLKGKTGLGLQMFLLSSVTGSLAQCSETLLKAHLKPKPCV